MLSIVLENLSLSADFVRIKKFAEKEKSAKGSRRVSSRSLTYLVHWDEEVISVYCNQLAVDCLLSLAIWTVENRSSDQQSTILFLLRYRAIMYPLRRKPSKLCSQIVIVLIGILSLAFALPMGIVHTFAYVPDTERGEAATKPFCRIDFGNGTSAEAGQLMFQYYR